MTMFLNIVRAELAAARERVARLEEIERLAAGLDGVVEGAGVGLLSSPGAGVPQHTETGQAEGQPEGTPGKLVAERQGRGQPSAAAEPGRVVTPPAKPSGAHGGGVYTAEGGRLNREAIVGLIRERPGITSKEIQLTLGLSQPVTDRHLRALADGGMIVREKRASRTAPSRLRITPATEIAASGAESRDEDAVAPAPLDVADMAGDDREEDDAPDVAELGLESVEDDVGLDEDPPSSDVSAADPAPSLPMSRRVRRMVERPEPPAGNPRRPAGAALDDRLAEYLAAHIPATPRYIARELVLPAAEIAQSIQRLVASGRARKLEDGSYEAVDAGAGANGRVPA
jgi:DNA-binding transcriptional ArsR family regulator